MPPWAPDARQSARLHAFDALRGGAMLLGVCYHAALSFLPGVAPYHFCEDRAANSSFVVLSWLLHSFRMQLFFVMAGCFTALGLARRTPGDFLSRRVRRLGGPLLVGAVLLAPLELGVRVLSARQGLLSPRYAGQTDWLTRPLYLWFLVYLLVFTALAALWARFGRRIHSSGAVLAAASLVSTVVLYFEPEPSPAFRWALDPASVVYFGAFFLAGAAFFAARERWARALRFWPWALGVAAAAAGLHLAYAADATGEPGRALRAVVASVYGWALIFALVGAATRWLSSPSRRVGFVAASAYWTYLAHYPLIIVAQVLIAPLPGPAAVKYMGLVLGVGALSMGTYALFVRGRWLGRALGESGGG